MRGPYDEAPEVPEWAIRIREAEIEQHFTRRIYGLGGETRKVAWRSLRGAPDRLVLLPGRVVWVELKAPGRRPRKSQEREHALLRWAGQTVLVIDSEEAVDAAFPA